MAEVPSREELQKLPWRAAVVFAARCARRVQSFANSDPDLAPETEERDFDGLVDWLELYQLYRMGKIIEGSSTQRQ